MGDAGVAQTERSMKPGTGHRRFRISRLARRPEAAASAAYRCARWFVPAASVRELDVERVTGDLRDPAFARSAPWPAAALVFHVAADYRLWAKDPSELYRSNVDGTRNLLGPRARPASSAWSTPAPSAASASRTAASAMKTVPVTLDEMAGDYKRSKFQAEQVALEFARDGLAGGDRESHRADRRSRCQAHAHRQDRRWIF